MNLRPLLGPVLVATSCAAFALACAASAEEIPNDDGVPGDNGGGAVLPPPSNGGEDAGGTSTSSSGSADGGTSSGATSSSGASGSSGGAIPACSFGGDFLKLLQKAAEIQAAAPCDTSCNPATHCCLDLLGGLGGGGGGLPIEAGAGGLPTDGVCVSSN